MSNPHPASREEYMARAEFAGRMLGHKLRSEYGPLILGALEATERGLLEEWLIVVNPNLNEDITEKDTETAA